MDKEKSMMDDAKGFLSMWKDEFATKNKDILERAEKRRQDAAAEDAEMKRLFDELKVEYTGIAKDLYDKLKINVEGFTTAVKEGTATVAEKLELEQGMKQLYDFLVATKNAGAEQFQKLSAGLKSKIDSFDTELKSERESLGADALNELSRRNSDMEADMKRKQDDIKNIFGDDE